MVRLTWGGEALSMTVDPESLEIERLEVGDPEPWISWLSNEDDRMDGPVPGIERVVRTVLRDDGTPEEEIVSARITDWRAVARWIDGHSHAGLREATERAVNERAAEAVNDLERWAAEDLEERLRNRTGGM